MSRYDSRGFQIASNTASPKAIGAIDSAVRVGLFGVGLEAYWNQFKDLKERLEGYLRLVASTIAREGVQVIDAGLVDSYETGLIAGSVLRRADVDIVFLYVTTYSLSATVLPILKRLNVPVIVLNLQPTSRIDYVAFNSLASRHLMTGEWLAYCSACPLPELMNVSRRCGIEMYQVTGALVDDPYVWSEIDQWLRAAGVIACLRSNRLGLLGHYYSGMLDIYTDLTLLSAVFGTYVDILEIDEISSIRSAISEERIEERIDYLRETFEIQLDYAGSALSEAARTSIALDELVAKHKLTSMAYYYKGSGVPENERTMSSMILGTSLLTARGIPVAGEYEVKNVLAMKILASLGVGGSFTEFYATDFEDDVVLMGHDGPGHVAMAEGRPKVRELDVYHGKVGSGLSIEMQVKHGPVTLLSIAENGGGGFRLIFAEAESVAGPTLAIGNTNSRYRFSVGARKFLTEWSAAGPAHHCAVGVGHVGDVLEKVGLLLGLPVTRVCR